MSSNLPAILGGAPVRDYTFRTTPEVGAADVQLVVDQILSRNWQAGADAPATPLAEGLELPANVLAAFGPDIAAVAVELVQMQAPGQRGVHVVPASNGTQTITVGLGSISKWAVELGVRKHFVGAEVLVPAATWQATAGAVLDRNMVPVLVDVLPGTLCIDPAAAEAAITDRTVAIIPVHLYDRMAAMDRIMEIATSHQLAVIEDCAHAHGARYRGLGAGTIGHVGSFSDQGSKILSSQEGGFLVTLWQELADQICSAVTCGRQTGVSKQLQFGNNRMPAAIAALLRGQLLAFAEQNATRLRTFEGFDSLVRADLGNIGLRVSDAQPEVDVTPTYKKVVHVDLGEWGGMSLDQWRAAMAAELRCEFATIYEPLPDSYVYSPHSDPAARYLSQEYWDAINPAAYKAPVADEAFRSVAVIEHAAFLDPRFPERFAEAAGKIKAHARRVAAEVPAA